MADLIIRDVNDDMLKRLKKRAAEHALPVDEEAKAILMRNIMRSRDDTGAILKEIRRVRNALPPMPEGFDVDAAIEEGRE